MNIDELEKIEIVGGDSFSCCQNRANIKIKDTAKLKKFLRGVLTLNREIEEQEAAFEKERELTEEAEQRKILKSQSRNEIFGGGIREIASGFGTSTIIVTPIKERKEIFEDGLTDEERTVQFKREFNSLRQKAWYEDLSVCGIVDTNKYKSNVDELTKGFYKKFNIALGGENVDELSSTPSSGLSIASKLDELIDKILSDNFGKPKKVEKVKDKPKEKKAQKPLKVKYTKPSGKPFTPEYIDEAAIWGNALEVGETKIPTAFRADKAEITPAEPKNIIDEKVQVTQGIAKDIPSLTVSKPIKPKRPQRFNYTRPSGKPFVAKPIDEAAIWGNALGLSEFNIPSSFAEDRVVIDEPIVTETLAPMPNVETIENAEIPNVEPTQKSTTQKPKRKRKKKTERTAPILNTDADFGVSYVGNNLENAKEATENGASENNVSSETKPFENSLSEGVLLEQDVKEQIDKKPANKKPRKKVSKKRKSEIVHLTYEEAARRYTLPKGKSQNFDVDENAIWGEQRLNRGYDLNSVLGGSFKADSIVLPSDKEDEPNNTNKK
ncbi:MAG: hypothetical protein SPD42_04090 [Eubacteriales bacterium]|nr:hypothetical protein [Eubacteriales bacterium]